MKKLRHRKWPVTISYAIVPYVMVQLLTAGVGDPIPGREWITWLMHSIIATLCITFIIFDEYHRHKDACYMNTVNNGFLIRLLLSLVPGTLASLFLSLLVFIGLGNSAAHCRLERLEERLINWVNKDLEHLSHKENRT